MGIRLPRRQRDDLCVWRRSCAIGNVCVVQREFRQRNASGRAEIAECVGTVRHARQRVGMVSGLVRGDVLRQQPAGKSARAVVRAISSAARRVVGQQYGELPLGSPQQRHSCSSQQQYRGARVGEDSLTLDTFPFSLYAFSLDPFRGYRGLAPCRKFFLRRRPVRDAPV